MPRALKNRVNDRSAKQPEVGRSGRYVDARQAVKDPVEQLGKETLDRRVGAGRADGLHHLIALAPALEEHRNELWRMLTIRVHHDDGVTTSRKQPGQDGRLMTEVSREAKPTDRRMCLPEELDLPPRPVGTAIVHDQNLEGRRRDRCDDRRNDRWKRLLLVVRGQDDGHERVGGSVC